MLLSQKNVSKQVNNYSELAENLILDLNSPKDNNLDFISFVKHLDQKILNESMEKINLFVNENK